MRMARMKRMNWNRLSRRIVVYTTLTVLAFSFALPFLWMVSTSLKSESEITQFPPTLFPHEFRWEIFRRVAAEMPLIRYLRNTVTIASLSTVGAILSSALVGYGFARFRWPGRDVLFFIVLATMMIPGAVTMVPLYILFRDFGWIDTFLPLIAPAWLAPPFYTFIMRQHFRTIPLEISDAARVDGASEIRIFWQVILPLARAPLAVVAIFQFFFAWDDFLNPLIYLNDQNKYTLALGIQQFQGGHPSEFALLMAASILMILPPLVVFYFGQRHLIRGMGFGGLKR
ncbi:MAG: carbohydrate ABC transporter permease [Candidatus Bipolaricaulia bacterium]